MEGSDVRARNHWRATIKGPMAARKTYLLPKHPDYVYYPRVSLKGTQSPRAPQSHVSGWEGGFDSLSIFQIWCVGPALFPLGHLGFGQKHFVSTHGLPFAEMNTCYFPVLGLKRIYHWTFLPRKLQQMEGTGDSDSVVHSRSQFKLFASPFCQGDFSKRE